MNGLPDNYYAKGIRDALITRQDVIKLINLILYIVLAN